MLNWIAAHILAMFWSMFTLTVVVCTAAVILNYRVQREMRAGSRMTESKHADAERAQTIPHAVEPGGKLSPLSVHTSLKPLATAGTHHA
jgi:hypothetical protein